MLVKIKQDGMTGELKTCADNFVIVTVNKEEKRFEYSEIKLLVNANKS
jgi:hypothetical protein